MSITHTVLLCFHVRLRELHKNKTYLPTPEPISSINDFKMSHPSNSNHSPSYDAYGRPSQPHHQGAGNREDGGIDQGFAQTGVSNISFHEGAHGFVEERPMTLFIKGDLISPEYFSRTTGRYPSAPNQATGMAATKVEYYKNAYNYRRIDPVDTTMEGNIVGTLDSFRPGGSYGRAADPNFGVHVPL